MKFRNLRTAPRCRRPRVTDSIVVNLSGPRSDELDLSQVIWYALGQVAPGCTVKRVYREGRLVWEAPKSNQYAASDKSTIT